MNDLAHNETIKTPIEPCPSCPACTAEVVCVNGDSIDVRPASDWSGTSTTVRSALPASVRVRPGDEVLVLGIGSGEAFIIARLATAEPEVLHLTDGTRVETETTGRSLVVRDSAGRTLFEYDVDKGGVLTLRGEAIRLQSRVGSIELDSAKDVKIRGHAVQLDGKELQFSAERIGLSGRELEAQLRRARIRLHRAEIVADVIVETARDVYRKVRGLAQLRAGRVRTITEGTVWLKAKQVIHRSTGAYKVRSDDIQLG